MPLSSTNIFQWSSRWFIELLNDFQHGRTTPSISPNKKMRYNLFLDQFLNDSPKRWLYLNSNLSKINPMQSASSESPRQETFLSKFLRWDESRIRAIYCIFTVYMYQQVINNFAYYTPAWIYHLHVLYEVS